MEPIKIWGVAVLATSQEAAAKAHCFGDCGKISMGGMISDPLGSGLFVCCEPVCPHMAEEFPGYGTTTNFGRLYDVTLRLLKPHKGADDARAASVDEAYGDVTGGG